MPRFSAHPTPNPNSLKITRDEGSFVDSGMLIFGSEAEASGNPLGEALFGISGIINVFAVPDFITVTKSSSASWDAVWPAVEAALDAHT